MDGANVNGGNASPLRCYFHDKYYCTRVFAYRRIRPITDDPLFYVCNNYILNVPWSDLCVIGLADRQLQNRSLKSVCKFCKQIYENDFVISEFTYTRSVAWDIILSYFREWHECATICNVYLLHSRFVLYLLAGLAAKELNVRFI